VYFTPKDGIFAVVDTAEKYIGDVVNTGDNFRLFGYL
jgi:hypothetical protein